MSADLELLLEPIRRAKATLRRGALIPAVLGVLPLLALPFLEGVVGYAICMVVMALCLGLSGLLFWESRRPPESHPGIVALQTPGRVSWVFLEQTRNAHTKETGEPVVKLGLQTGERLMLPLIEGREEEFLRAASGVAPRATCGWTPDLELAYVQAPASLLRES